MSENLEHFFDNPRANSIVKASIVSKYFEFWANTVIQILKGQEQKWGRKKQSLAYVDLFSGPGKYEEGTPSTPLLVLGKSLKSPDICDRMRITFNDSSAEHVETLRHVINNFIGIDRFKFRPKVTNIRVERQLAKAFRSWPNMPILLFVDAFGYKELSLELIESVMRKWGSDCVFFFNFNRVNLAIDNPRVTEHLDPLFGRERAEKLRRELGSFDSEERELHLVKEFSNALEESSSDGSPRRALWFKFRNPTRARTSHYLVHVTRHSLGYNRMKEIMAEESSSRDQGVASFEYSEAISRQPLLFSLSPLAELEESLLSDFAGKSLKMIDIYDQHNVGTRFIRANYKTALRQLYDSGKIETSRPPRGTTSFADDIIVTFPPNL